MIGYGQVGLTLVKWRSYGQCVVITGMFTSPTSEKCIKGHIYSQGDYAHNMFLLLAGYE